MKKPKKHYYIIFNGNMVGETWAVSPAKARVNFWWKFIKYCDADNPCEHNPEEFDVIEADNYKKH